MIGETAVKEGIIYVNAKYCAGCGICVEFCPRQVLELSPDPNEKAVHVVCVVQPERCTACRQCEMFCPNFAIAVAEKEAV